MEEDKGAQVGELVAYFLSDGQERPAIVVRRWSDNPAGAVQLVVFIDGSNDVPGATVPVQWATSRVEGTAPGQFQRFFAS